MLIAMYVYIDAYLIWINVKKSYKEHGFRIE